MKILYLTLKRNSIRTHYKSWHQALRRYCDLDIRYREVKTKEYWKYFQKMLKYPSDLRAFIKDKQKRALHPAIRLDIVNNNYDFLITDFPYMFFTEPYSKIKIPKICIVEDTGNAVNTNYIKKISECGFDALFCRYRQEFLKYQKSYVNKFNKLEWLPWGVNLDIFKDYGLEKEYDVTMAGYHFPPYYYYRYMAFDILEDKKYFTELPHLGYFEKEDGVYGEDYAKFLNKSKISITCGMVYNRPVMKFYEIPASRTLLVANMFKELSELGFKHNENMVVMDLDNLDKQMKDLIADDDMRNEITDNGYKFVRENHSVDIRAKQFIEELKSW
jgi:hypothetical protein